MGLMLSTISKKPFRSVKTKKMRILFLPKYSESGPSSRYRFYQYLELISRSGLSYKVAPLFDEKYVHRFYTTGKKSIILTVIGFINRFFIMITSWHYDLIVVEYELFPYMPGLFESLINLTGKKMILDFDDAVFVRYQNSSNPLIRFLLRKKIFRVVQLAQGVIVGNRYLYDEFISYNKNISLIPTVVSSKLYDSVVSGSGSDKCIIGWIGSLSTSRYLLPLCDIFRTFDKESFQLNLIGFDKRLRDQFEGINVEWIDWKRETEITEIKKFSVGIMPLDDDLWSRGKCGFKIIQYMACRVPVIASPVGVNSEIIEDGINGFLASDPDEWRERIRYFISNREVAKKMGNSAYEKFVRNYSLERNYLKYLDVIGLSRD